MAQMSLLLLALAASCSATRYSTFDKSRDDKICFSYGYAGGTVADCALQDASGDIDIHSAGSFGQMPNVKAVDIAQNSDGRIIGFVARNASHIYWGSFSTELGRATFTFVGALAAPIFSAQLDIRLFNIPEMEATSPFPFVGVFIISNENATMDVLAIRRYSPTTRAFDTIWTPQIAKNVTLFDVRQNATDPKTLLIAYAIYSTKTTELVAFTYSEQIFFNSLGSGTIDTTFPHTLSIAVDPIADAYCWAFGTTVASGAITSIYKANCAYPVFSVLQKFEVASALGNTDDPPLLVKHSLQFSPVGFLCIQLLWSASEIRYYHHCERPLDIYNGASTSMDIVSNGITQIGSSLQDPRLLSLDGDISNSSLFCATASLGGKTLLRAEFVQTCSLSFYNAMQTVASNSSVAKSISSTLSFDDKSYCSLFRFDSGSPTISCMSTALQQSWSLVQGYAFQDAKNSGDEFYDSYLQFNRYGNLIRFSRSNRTMEVAFMGSDGVKDTSSTQAGYISVSYSGYNAATAPQNSNRSELNMPGVVKFIRSPALPALPDPAMLPKFCIVYADYFGLLVDCFAEFAESILNAAGGLQPLSKIRPMNATINSPLLEHYGANITGVSAAVSPDNRFFGVAATTSSGLSLLICELGAAHPDTSYCTFDGARLTVTAFNGLVKLISVGTGLSTRNDFVFGTWVKNFPSGSFDFFLSVPPSIDTTPPSSLPLLSTASVESFEMFQSRSNSSFFIVVTVASDLNIHVHSIDRSSSPPTYVHSSFSLGALDASSIIRQTSVSVSPNSNAFCVDLRLYTSVVDAPNYAVYCVNMSLNPKNGSEVRPWYSVDTTLIPHYNTLAWNTNGQVCFGMAEVTSFIFSCAMPIFDVSTGFTMSTPAITYSLGQSTSLGFALAKNGWGLMMLDDTSGSGAIHFYPVNPPHTNASRAYVPSNPATYASLSGDFNNDMTKFCFSATVTNMGQSTQACVNVTLSASTSTSTAPVVHLTSSSRHDTMFFTPSNNLCVVSKSNATAEPPVALRCNENPFGEFFTVNNVEFRYIVPRAQIAADQLPRVLTFNIPSPIVSSTPSPIATPTATPTPTPSPTPTEVNCSPGSTGSANFTYINGTCVSSGQVNVTSETVVWTTPIIVAGNLTVQSQVTLVVESAVNVSGNFVVGTQSVLVVSSNSTVLVNGDLVIRSQSQLQLDQGNESSVKIANCLDAAGATLNISVSTSGSYTALNFTCMRNPFDKVVGYSKDPCDQVDARSEYSTSGLQVIFTIGPASSCTPPPTGLDPIYIIAIAVAGGLLLIIVIIVAVIFGIKSIRQKVLPHRDREKWSKGGVY